MPRRPAEVHEGIPLFLIPHIVLQGIRAVGEELERITIRKTARHYYNISIRSRSINRELQRALARAGVSAARAVNQEGVA